MSLAVTDIPSDIALLCEELDHNLSPEDLSCFRIGLQSALVVAQVALGDETRISRIRHRFAPDAFDTLPTLVEPMVKLSEGLKSHSPNSSFSEDEAASMLIRGKTADAFVDRVSKALSVTSAVRSHEIIRGMMAVESLCMLSVCLLSQQSAVNQSDKLNNLLQEQPFFGIGFAAIVRRIRSELFIPMMGNCC